MATYIKGVTDTLPGPMKIAPDYKLLATSLGTLQERYNKGFDQVKTVYNSLINSQLSSPDNQQFRNDYLKKADAALSQLSGVDFSNPNNVGQATNLFKPLISDPEYVADLNWTMQQQAEAQKLESVKNNPDEKIRSQYSNVLERAMTYAYQDMQQTKRGDGSIFKVPVQKYTPFTNLNEVLDKAAKELKLQVKVDSLSGEYIVTDTNGKNAIPVFTQWARQHLGPEYDQQLLITSKVNMRDQLNSIMSANPNLSKEDAYQKLASANALGIYQNNANYVSSLNTGISTIDKKIAEISSRFSGKVLKGSEEYNSILQLKQLRNTYSKELADATQNGANKDQQLKAAFESFMKNPEYAMMPLYKDALAKSWAEGYAMTTVEHKIEANPVAMAHTRMAFDEMMANRRMAFDAEQKRLDRENDLMKTNLTIKSHYDLAMAKGEISSVYSSPMQLAGEGDEYRMYQEEKTNLENQIIPNYLNETVLKAAAHSDNLAADFNQTSTTLVNALNYVMSNWGAYSTGNDSTFNKSYKIALSYLQRVNPALKRISDPNQILQVIGSSFKGGYTGGDPTTWSTAKNMVAVAERSFDQYTKLVSTENKNKQFIETSQPKLWTWDYFDKSEYERTGKHVPRADLSPEKRQMLYQYLIPNYQKYSDNKRLMTTGFTIKGANSKKFDYNAIQEVIDNADYVGDASTDKIDLSSSKALDLKKTLAGSGGTLADFFNPDGITIHYQDSPTGGYMKVTIPVDQTKKKDGRVLPTSSGSLTFYIPKNKALNMWKGMGTVNFGDTSYGVPEFKSLHDIPQKIFASTKPVDWIDTGINNQKSTEKVIPFPKSYLTQYGIEDGYLESNSVNGALSVVVKVDGTIYSEPLGGLTIGEYNSDPKRYSEAIDNAIVQKLTDYDVQNTARLRQKHLSHQTAVQHNPGAYVNIKDIQ
jgi:hypothetical protein